MERELEIELESRRDEVIQATQFTLVGKILTSKSLNKIRVIGVLKNVWSIKEVVHMRELNGNLYAISFVEKASDEGP